MELKENQKELLKKLCKEDSKNLQFTTALCIIEQKLRRSTIKNIEIAQLLDLSEVTISKYSPIIDKYFKLQEGAKK